MKRLLFALLIASSAYGQNWDSVKTTDTPNQGRVKINLGVTNYIMGRRVDTSGWSAMNRPLLMLQGDSVWVAKEGIIVGADSLAIPMMVTADSMGSSDWIHYERDSSNMFFGVDSGFRSAGFGNIAIGKGASLRGDDSTFFNVAIGYECMENNTGYRNTAVGANSQEFNTTGYNNTSIGAFAMQWNTTGSRNTALGYAALYNNIDGWWNTAVGYAARWEAIGGNYNTAVGYYSQMTDTSGDKNSALGYFSLYKNYADGNTAMGYAAMYGNTSGEYNTAIGHAAGYENTQGNYNIFLGYNSGNGYQVDANNQFIAGSHWGPIWDVYFGEGKYDSTPGGYTIHGTTAQGTNVAGGDITLQAGNSTGNAIGGQIIFKTTAPYQGSGSSENENSRTAVWIDTYGNFTVDTTLFRVDAVNNKVIMGDTVSASTEKFILYNGVYHMTGATNARRGLLFDRGTSLVPTATQGAIFVQTNGLGSDDGMIFRADGYKMQSEDSVDRIFITSAGKIGLGSGTPDSTVTMFGSARVSGNALLGGLRINASGSLIDSGKVVGDTLQFWVGGLSYKAQRRDSVGIGGSGIDAATAAGMISDSVAIRSDDYAPAGTYLVPSDSTSIRNYSSVLYLKNADSTTLKNSVLSQVLKNADSTTLKNSVLSQVLKNADSTKIRNYSTSLYLKNADSTTLKNALLKNADSTTIRNYSNALYMAKASATPIFSAGLIDSVKTSDTVFVGFIAPAATIDSIVYSGARSQSLTARLEMVDSLYQTAGVTLLDTTTCTTILRKRTSAVAGGSFALTLGKIVRMVFPAVGTMPKSFNVTIVGHR